MLPPSQEEGPRGLCGERGEESGGGEMGPLALETLSSGALVGLADPVGLKLGPADAKATVGGSTGQAGVKPGPGNVRCGGTVLGVKFTCYKR